MLLQRVIDCGIILIFHLIRAQYYMYEWPSDDRKYDFIVGIAVGETPVSQGVIISDDTVLTSANPLEAYWKLNASQIKIYAIAGKLDTSRRLKIKKIYGNRFNRTKLWVQTGFDRSHSSIHDLILISLDNAIKETGSMYPLIAKLPQSNFLSYMPSGWLTAGFGYVDKQHLTTNTKLEVTEFENGVLVDCDELIPREWGRFICVGDIGDIIGIPSGGPLMNTENYPLIYGIGCFTLRKGNDTIAVFTDMTVYWDGIDLHPDFNTNITST